MLVIKRFRDRKKIFRKRKKTEKIRAKRYICGPPGLSRGRRRLTLPFCLLVWKVLSGMKGILETFGGGFEQDIDDKGEEDKEDQEGDGEVWE
ncbi:hypothetical protein Tco_1293109 [Tanacetum coccineum]